jgi:D-alanyl-D-alanine carboxypeptidase (penicillin-binding protein 5/6)
MKPTQKKRERGKPSLPLVLIIIFVVCLASWIAPIPKIKAQSTYSYRSHPEAVGLAWPAYGQAAVGAVDYGLLDSHGPQIQAPMASITKTITAMAVLKKKPLSPGDQGPTIRMTSQDVAAYNDYYSKGGSVVNVNEGEQISEYQALQALLLPSANNMADTLARWAFGSVDDYVTFANNYVRTLGLRNTTLGDASGFSSKSISTAEDLTVLGISFINNPVLRDIVSQQTAELPVAGTVRNTNWLLGTDGITGIKTGNTEQAGGCYLFAAHRVIEGQTLTIVGAVMSAPDLQTAISDSRTLLDSIDKGFTTVTVVKKNQNVGLYVSGWGDVVNVLSKQDVSILTWKTRQVRSDINIVTNDVSVTKGDKIGTVTALAWDKKVSSDLIASDSLNAPSWQWRLYKRHFGG